jgi:hypothetical protein
MLLGDYGIHAASTLDLLRAEHGLIGGSANGPNLRLVRDRDGEFSGDRGVDIIRRVHVRESESALREGRCPPTEIAAVSTSRTSAIGTTKWQIFLRVDGTCVSRPVSVSSTDVRRSDDSSETGTASFRATAA